MKTPEEIEKIVFELYQNSLLLDDFLVDSQPSVDIEKVSKEVLMLMALAYTKSQQCMADEIRRWRGAVERQEKRCEALREIAQQKFTQEQVNNAIKFAIKSARFNYTSQEKDLWQYNEDQIIQSVNEQLS